MRQSDEMREEEEERLLRLRQESCEHKWYDFHDGDDRVCEKCKRNELRPDSDSALLISARSRLSALEGLLRESRGAVQGLLDYLIEDDEDDDMERAKALLSRLDAALTPGKDQDGR